MVKNLIQPETLLIVKQISRQKSESQGQNLSHVTIFWISISQFFRPFFWLVEKLENGAIA